MTDPLNRAALTRMVALSAEIQVQLEQTQGGAPVLALLAKARNHAANALVAMAEVDPEEPKLIRALQNELNCFALIVQWMKEIVAEGLDAGDTLDVTEREDLAETLGLADETD
jgi:hypothetical protein